MAENKDIVIPFEPHEIQWEMWGNRKRFNVYLCHRRFGKTVYEVNRLIRGCLSTKREDYRAAYIAPLLKQAKTVAWDYFKYFLSVVPGVKFNESELKVDLPNGSRISLYGTDNPDSLRGIYLDDCAIDEVEQMHPDLWGLVIRPALSDRKGSCDFIGTPKGMGLFYDLYKKSELLPDWLCETYKVDDTLDRIGKQIGLDWEEIEEAKSTMTNAQFRQEFLCDWGASQDDVYIPLDILVEARGKHISEEQWGSAVKIIGVDVGRDNDETIIAKRQGIVLHPLVCYHIPDNMVVANKIATVIDEFKPDAVFIDQGAGVGVIDRLRQLGYSVIEVPFGSRADDPTHFYNKRAEMYGRAKEWLKIGGALPDDQKLVADLSSPELLPDTIGRIKLEPKSQIRGRLGRSPDRADAFVLTFSHNVMPNIIQRAQSTRKRSNWHVFDRFKNRGL